MTRVICNASFSELWACKFEAVDDTNRRGRGWSQVGKIDFLSNSDLAADSAVAAYLKRQQNYRAKTFRHPISGIATLRREHEMLRQVHASGVGVAEPLFFAEAVQARAVLVVEALQGYRSLDLYSADHLRNQPASGAQRAERRQVIALTARLVRRFHNLGICHGCLYPKHLFWNAQAGDIRLIDWEKARYSQRRKRSMLRDLDSLNRHALGWSIRERIWFLADYLGVAVGDPALKPVWKKLLVKYRLKVNR